MKNLSIGFFGAGNMTRAIVKGINTNYPKTQFYFYTPTKTKASDLANEFKGTLVENLSEMPKDLDYYFLGFKPQNLLDFHFDFKNESKIISMLAGIDTAKLESQFQQKNILRIMPNTPMRIGQGVTLAIFSSGFDLNSKKELEDIFSSFSQWVLVKSDLEVDQLTAYTGSMPGILFEIFKMFEASLAKWNITGVSNKELLLKAILGSVLLADSEKEKSFEELRNEVTSQKGITEAAIKTLNELNLDSIIHQSFVNAYKRSVELKEGK